MPDPKSELDTWHSQWLFDCPEGEQRYVLVWKDKDGNVTRRETYIEKEEAENRHFEAAVEAHSGRVFMLSFYKSPLI